MQIIKKKLRRFLLEMNELALARSPDIRKIAHQNRFAISLARAAATSGIRVIDPKDPLSWEFSGFSQNGEDGIIDYLCANVSRRNRHFVEIGSADGLENNSSWLAMGRRYTGLMIEGDPDLSQRCREALDYLNLGLRCLNLYVNLDNLKEVLAEVAYTDPDFFSLDIDGIDYYIARAILDSGMRPKVFAVEYNSNFGPELSTTVPYSPQFDRWKKHPSGMYYGVSIAGWRKLFSGHGYSFVTVDSNGVNAFFIDPAAFPSGFADGLKGLEYRENIMDLSGPDPSGIRPARIGEDWHVRFEAIRSLPFSEI